MKFLKLVRLTMVYTLLNKYRSSKFSLDTTRVKKGKILGFYSSHSSKFPKNIKYPLNNPSLSILPISQIRPARHQQYLTHTTQGTNSLLFPLVLLSVSIESHSTIHFSNWTLTIFFLVVRNFIINFLQGL